MELSRGFGKVIPVLGLQARGAGLLSSAVAPPVAMVLSRGCRKWVPLHGLKEMVKSRLARGAESLSSAVAFRGLRRIRHLREEEDAKESPHFAALGRQPGRACKA